MKFFLKKILCSIGKFVHLKRCSGSSCLKKTKNSDLFIIEFPKSGITWLSTILANVALIKSGQSFRVTHFNLEQYIGDVHVSKEIDSLLIYPNGRIIKSHEKYRKEYRHVIYLVRNPISVMSSYYFFAVNNNQYSGNFSDFIKSKKFGIDQWVTHVDSWLNPLSPLKLHVIRYEDLIDTPHKTICNLFQNIGWDVAENVISEALERSSFSEMKSDNDRYKLNNPARKYDFIREGKKEVVIDEEDRLYILGRSKVVGRLVYPELYS